MFDPNSYIYGGTTRVKALLSTQSPNIDTFLRPSSPYVNTAVVTTPGRFGGLIHYVDGTGPKLYVTSVMWTILAEKRSVHKCQKWLILDETFESIEWGPGQT